MTVSGQSNAVAYAYDNDNRLTGITQGTAGVTFTYDATGRRTSLTLPDGIVVNYGYDAGSELTAPTYSEGGNVLGNLTYAYDQDGRRTQLTSTGENHPTRVQKMDMTVSDAQFAPRMDLRGGANTYTWDARNHLSSISGTYTASFEYALFASRTALRDDPLGRRLQKTVSGTTTDFLCDGSNPVQELSGTTATANLLTGLGVDEYFMRTDSTGTSNFLADALGSTISLADATGAVQTEYTYDPYGGTTTQVSANANSYQFTGRENDGDGLYYYRARYYDPMLSRFISQDPIGYVGGINFYRYASDGPVIEIDPLGLWCIKRIMLVTSYNDTGPGSDWNYYKPQSPGQAPGSVGPGTVAVANTSPKPYPYGRSVTVYAHDGKTVVYTGKVHDTGAGWNAQHHDVQPDQWIDIWLPGRQANRWGVKYTWVKICNDSGCKQK